MAIIAKVKQATGRVIQALVAGRYNLTARLTGDDSPPLENDQIVLVHIEGSGDYVAIATLDSVGSTVEPGERRLYSRDELGEVAATIYLKRDGTIELNGGATIDTDGTLIVPDVKVGPLQVSLLTHIHTTPSGPSGPPQAGA